MHKYLYFLGAKKTEKNVETCYKNYLIQLSAKVEMFLQNNQIVIKWEQRTNKHHYNVDHEDNNCDVEEAQCH